MVNKRGIYTEYTYYILRLIKKEERPKPSILFAL